MEIHFLGTGSAYPSKERDNTSLCLSSGGYHVLVDVSANPCQKLKQLNIDLGELDSVIFTHFHIDHTYGLPSLLWGMWLGNRTKQLTIFCDVRYEKKLHEWLATIEVNEWQIQFSIHIETFNGSLFEGIIAKDDLNISVFPAIHSVPTIGLEIKFKDKLVIYSGDSEVNSFIKSYLFIDLLIHEATTARKSTRFHTSAKEVLNTYDLTAIQAVILIHLTDHEPYDKEISKISKITLAEDMMTLKITE